MPMVDIKLTGPLTKVTRENLIKEVSEAVARSKPCPIEAVAISITELAMDQMGVGGETWERKVGNEAP